MPTQLITASDEVAVFEVDLSKRLSFIVQAAFLRLRNILHTVIPTARPDQRRVEAGFSFYSLCFAGRVVAFHAIFDNTGPAFGGYSQFSKC
ncbi:MAG: hypothetical protein LBR82_03165 [Desulfovibrio sp.]|nr:hypothetical protein [Desulfovibrio sp.]